MTPLHLDVAALLASALADVAELRASTRKLLAHLEAHPLAQEPARKVVAGWVVRGGSKRGEGPYLRVSEHDPRARSWRTWALEATPFLTRTRALDEVREAAKWGSACRVVVVTRKEKP